MTTEERAFRAGFNRGMEYMAALEMGNPVLGEDEAYQYYVAPRKHLHIPVGSVMRVDPCRDIYYSTCIVCGKPISITGLELARDKGRILGWKEVKNPPKLRAP